MPGTVNPVENQGWELIGHRSESTIAILLNEYNLKILSNYTHTDVQGLIKL